MGLWDRPQRAVLKRGIVRGNIIYEELPGNLLGRYEHETDTIHVDCRLPKRDRFLTLIHEGFHRQLGHGPAPKAVCVAREILVEQMTARYFIPFRSLLEAFIQCGSVTSMAKFLHVDDGLVYSRMLTLTPLEAVVLEVCGRQCIGIDTAKPVL